jgi:hypothetical protein
VLAAKHLLDFGGFDFGVERLDRALQVGGDVLALLRPLEQDAEIVQLADQGIAEIDLFAQAAPALKRLLRLGLVLPEVRRGDALLERRQLARGVGRVKDSSEDPWRV